MRKHKKNYLQTFFLSILHEASLSYNSRKLIPNNLFINLGYVNAFRTVVGPFPYPPKQTN